MTKNLQTEDNILKMVGRAFSEDIQKEDVLIRELTEGCFNVAYLISFKDKEVILKIAPSPEAMIMTYEKNIMEAEVLGLTLVRKTTKVLVPKVLFYDTSRELCDAPYFFMELLSGSSFYQLKAKSMPEKKQSEILYEIGKWNFEINQIKGEYFGYLGRADQLKKSWKETFLCMIEDILLDGERINISLGVAYDEIRMLIEKLKDCLDEIVEPVLVHWDLWEGNVFINNGKLSGVIDFERSLWGDPLMEYFFRRHAYNPDFVKGYGRDLRTEAPLRALLYDLYLYLIMTIETEYRNYQDDSSYKFALGELNITISEIKKLLHVSGDAGKTICNHSH